MHVLDAPLARQFSYRYIISSMKITRVMTFHSFFFRDTRALKWNEILSRHLVLGSKNLEGLTIFQFTFFPKFKYAF